MQFSVAQIIEITNGTRIKGDPKQTVCQISTDTRTLNVGDLFLALVGEHFDGHNFLEQALLKGAVGIVVSRFEPAMISLDFPLMIEVEDTLQAYGNLAQAHRQEFDQPIVAVTGSNGKTTTKEMIASVLSQQFQIFKSEKNYNNLIGVPKRLLEMKDSQHEIAIFELGTNQPGEIGRLAEIVRPTVGVITNIGFSHLEFLGGINGVTHEKTALLESVAVAVLNSDDSILSNFKIHSPINRINFGQDSDISAQDLILDENGFPSFTIVVQEPINYAAQVGSIDINLPCFGSHNVSNALAATAVGLWAGLSLDQVKAGLESFSAVEMRLQPLTIDGFRIINDAYNSNPDSLQSALNFCAELPTSGKRIAVLGDMLELGAQSVELHFQIGQNIPTAFQLLITVGQESQQIARGAEDRIEQTVSCRSVTDAVVALSQQVAEGDTVLVKGSRGMRLELIIEALMTEYDSTTQSVVEPKESVA